MYDPHLLEEIEEVFHDANENFSMIRRNTIQIKKQAEEDKSSKEQLSLLPEGETPDPPTRTELPFFKDPKIKISFWTILKDSLHKDISKMSVPVYFNQPLNVLQACG